MSEGSIIHASCKGKKGDLPYQDYVSVQEYPSYSFAVVADGLGSSKSSARGANMICSLLADRFNSVAGFLFDIREVANDAIEKWYAHFDALGIPTRDCLTTCSFILIDLKHNIAKIGFIGDSPVFYRVNKGVVVSSMTKKDFLNETYCIGTSKRPQFDIKEIPFATTFDFMLCSDGFGDEIIVDKVDALFDYLIERYSAVSIDKRNRLLKQELVSSMQNINNDDKSIVFGWICQAI